jgi:hypothetical protein
MTADAARHERMRWLQTAGCQKNVNFQTQTTTLLQPTHTHPHAHQSLAARVPSRPAHAIRTRALTSMLCAAARRPMADAARPHGGGAGCGGGAQDALADGGRAKRACQVWSAASWPPADVVRVTVPFGSLATVTVTPSVEGLLREIENAESASSLGNTLARLDFSPLGIQPAYGSLGTATTSAPGSLVFALSPGPGGYNAASGGRLLAADPQLAACMPAPGRDVESPPRQTAARGPHKRKNSAITTNAASAAAPTCRHRAPQRSRMTASDMSVCADAITTGVQLVCDYITKANGSLDVHLTPATVAADLKAVLHAATASLDGSPDQPVTLGMVKLGVGVYLLQRVHGNTREHMVGTGSRGQAVNQARGINAVAKFLSLTGGRRTLRRHLYWALGFASTGSSSEETWDFRAEDFTKARRKMLFCCAGSSGGGDSRSAGTGDRS